MINIDGEISGFSSDVFGVACSDLLLSSVCNLVFDIVALSIVPGEDLTESR